MCRNIRTLFNFDPPATEVEIRNAASQYVRKVSGFNRPSAVNQEAFNMAVDGVFTATASLLGALTASTSPKNREVESAKAHARAVRRFGR